MRKSTGLAVGAAIAISMLWCSWTLAESFPAVKVYEQTSSSVVLIVASESGKSINVGAGSLLDSSGLVLTCAHVFMSKEPGSEKRRVQVFLKPEKVIGDFLRDLTRRYEANVVAADEKLDLALLKIDGLPSGIGPLKLADPKDINIGEEVVAIGHPEQGGLWSLTYGRISGEIETQMGVLGKDVYQTDTSVNRGNSGGPLLDRRGYIVGVNANVARMGAGNMPITGVNFAIKSGVVKKWMEKKGYTVAYGTLPLEGPKDAPPAPSKTVVETPKSVTPEKVQAVDEAKPEQKADTEGKTGSTATQIQQKPMTRSKEEAGKSPDQGQPSDAPKTEETMGKESAKDKYKALDSKKKSDQILTPIKPYRIEDMFTVVEKEMEDMMEDMKRKIRK